jgi:hypothetical protein
MNSAFLARRLLLVVVMRRLKSKRPMAIRKRATMISARGYRLEPNGSADSCGERVQTPATPLLLGLGLIGSAAFRYGRF